MILTKTNQKDKDIGWNKSNIILQNKKYFFGAQNLKTVSPLLHPVYIVFAFSRKLNIIVFLIIVKLLVLASISFLIAILQKMNMY